MIERIETLEPKLDIRPLGKVEILKYRRIQAVQSVLPHIAELRREVADVIGKLLGRVGVEPADVERRTIGVSRIQVHRPAVVDRVDAGPVQRRSTLPQ